MLSFLFPIKEMNTFELLPIFIVGNMRPNRLVLIEGSLKEKLPLIIPSAQGTVLFPFIIARFQTRCSIFIPFILVSMKKRLFEMLAHLHLAICIPICERALFISLIKGAFKC